MKKLEDIPKESIFKVPDDYFEKLPAVIQTRMAKSNNHISIWSLSWKFALPVVALVVAGIFWFSPSKSLEVELNEIDADQIAYFLEDAELVAFEEGHENEDNWSTIDLDELENAVYSELDLSNDSNNILDNIDLENL